MNAALDTADAISTRIVKLEEWLREQGVDVKQEQAHLTDGSRERLYWHYGYLIGLRDALKATQSRLALAEGHLEFIASGRGNDAAFNAAMYWGGYAQFDEHMKRKQ